MTRAARISRVPGRRQVLVVWQPTGPPEPARRRERHLHDRLRRLYQPVFGTGLRITTRQVPGAGALVTVVEESGGRARLGDVVVWGDPIGQRGPASDTEIAAALRDRRRLRDLLGSFVVLALGPDRITIHSGADLVHTLVRCDGPSGQAWSTHGLAAAVATGRRLYVVPERIPEFVVHDFVYCDEHLLDGITALPEATTVAVTGTRVTTRPWWPETDRLRSAETDTDDVATVLDETLSRILADRPVCLGLTAGRDSNLLAGTAARLGLTLPTFTMGGRDTPDGAGAAAVAERLDWRHDVVTPQPGPPSVDRLLRRTRLSEGLDTAWNFYGPDLSWPPDLPPVRISGVGGEMGRAFYWADLPDRLRRDPVTAMWQWPAGGFSPDGAATFRVRCERYAEQLLADGWRDTGVFDAWHARGRVRRWVASTPPPPRTSVCTVYTNAAVASALLGLPPEDRERHHSFDALSRRTGDLHLVAQRAVDGLPRAGRWATSRWGRRWSRLRGEDAGRDWVPRCLAELGGGPPLAARVIGVEWWNRQSTEVLRRRASPHPLWNALAVEALHHLCRELNEASAIL